jgi:hypothetical protein
MWQAFLQYGDKVFAIITGILALLISMKMVSGDVAQWVLFASAALNIIHTTLLPEPAKT